MALETIKVAGPDALAELEKRRAAFAATGQYPFLIGNRNYWQGIGEGDDAPDPAAIIAASRSIDTAAWFAESRQAAEKYEFDEAALTGEWDEDARGRSALTLHLDARTRQPYENVFIGLANIEAAWQLPAVLGYGSWNSCASPEVHCALHRDWQERFGAEIAGMSHDVIECIVKNPPQDRETALRLAWEQYWYCGDIVDQGCETVSYLAAALMGSHHWFFWWD